MPVVEHISSIHSKPFEFLRYIANDKKTKGSELITGINISEDPSEAFIAFRRTYKKYSTDDFFQNDKSNKTQKEKILLHHYVQSFCPEEKITPDEAHKIGIEWAKKVFGDDHQIVVSTHIDKGHLHNHFAVSSLNMYGKKWHDNQNTLKRARKISDEIALEHGLHIIENPKHKNTTKYSEWLAKQNGTSWKQQLAADIDKLILCEDVQSISDLTDKLNEHGYTVRSGKYLSIKAPKQKNAIRSFRLGDGYSVDDLQYRILHKEQEISLSAIQKYSGIQRECDYVDMCAEKYRMSEEYRNAEKKDPFEAMRLLNMIVFEAENAAYREWIGNVPEEKNEEEDEDE